LKSIIKSYFSNFFYFYKYIGNKLFFSVILSLAIGFLDGFGLVMFLPLLKMAADSKTVVVDNGSFGKFSFLIDFANSLNVPITLASVLILMVIFFLIKGIAKYYSSIYKVIIKQAFIKKLRSKMLKAFNKITFKSFITADIGRIQNTMSGEVDRVARGFTMYNQTMEQAVLVFVYIGFAFFIDFKFAFLVTLGGLSTNLVYRYFYSLFKKVSSALTFKSNIYHGQIIQHVGNFKYLKATSLLENYALKLHRTMDEIEENRKKIGYYSSILGAIREPMLIIILSAVILVQVNLLDGNLGSIVVSLLFFYRSLNSLTAMQSNWSSFLEISGSMNNLQAFQNDLLASEEKLGGLSMNKFQDKIELRDVTVKYNESVILNKINLEILKNESIAFVGESGSGKTTLVNVISGLIEPNSGDLFIDNVHRRDLDIRSFQKRIGYVTQEPVIFNDTIFNNVTFWAEKNEENIKRFDEAIEKASLKMFLSTLPDKENCLLGHNGINISGGQKQRISIARELFKEIDILFLDEATSALDTETEKLIQASIDALYGQYTIIMVAHRLSTVKNVDRIVVLKRGIINAVDSFENLKDNNLDFRRMVELQAMSSF
jgi:ABC-type multidrug transport system fused ATPase/permease subunit